MVGMGVIVRVRTGMGVGVGVAVGVGMGVGATVGAGIAGCVAWNWGGCVRGIVRMGEARGGGGGGLLGFGRQLPPTNRWPEVPWAGGGGSWEGRGGRVQVQRFGWWVCACPQGQALVNHRLHLPPLALPLTAPSPFPSGAFGAHKASDAFGAHGLLRAAQLATNRWP